MGAKSRKRGSRGDKQSASVQATPGRKKRPKTLDNKRLLFLGVCAADSLLPGSESAN